MNIVLTGPMGAGKTSAGRLVAELLGRDFADSDGIIERRHGCTVNEIFERNGEERFREMESEVIEELSRKDNTIIAAGGGAVLRPGNMRRLRSNGVIVNLSAPAVTLLERLGGSAERPLLSAFGNSSDGLKRYLAERAWHYSNCDHRIETGSLTLEEVAERVHRVAEMPLVRICACIGGRDAAENIRNAVSGGATMAELRLDLIPDPDIEGLVRNCPLPVIATDRNNPENLKKAILAGCDFVDVDIHCAEKGMIFEMARGRGCRAIVSLHDMDGVPDTIPERHGADLLKVAATLNSTDDLKKLVGLHNRRDDVIIAAMGPLGGLLRVFGPMLGSYLTYCSMGEPTATGQLDLKTMNDIYRGMKLR